MKPAPYASNQSDEATDDAAPLDPNTTLDIYISPSNTITELADTVDTLDGIRAETIDILNEKDGTHLEVIQLEEPSSEHPDRDIVDNFVSVEGIGPEVAALLLAGGIHTFRQLASTPVERIRTILEAAGPHFRLHDAAEWPERAGQLANPQPFDKAAEAELPYGFAQWPNEKSGGHATA